MGLQANTNNLVGIYAKNCVEWGIAEQAIYTYSMVLVPFYEQLGADSKKYILRETSMSVVICGNDETVNKILESEPPHSLQAIVSIRDVKKTTFDRAAAFGIRILKFHDVEEYGSKNLVKDVPPLPQSPAIICFNKISAFGDYLLGHPKGVILSHENIVSCATACVHQLGKYAPAINDVMISYLPLAHMLERCCQVAVLFSGGAIGFYSGDMRLLSDDLKLLKPTIIPAVPRIFNRMYDKIVKRIHSSNLRRTVFNMGLKRKTVQMEKFIIKNNTFWDKLLFSRVKRMLGGRCRLMVVGSAPLAGNILTFLRASLGCIIVEGYGQTECAGCCTLTVHGDYTTEHVGPPIPCSAIKLCDVPELEYFSSIGQGEICIRGSNVFLGYFKDPEKTKYVIDEEGWLHTGDIGQWLPNGCLKIIDRKKHIFKLSQGEYIVPDVIENIYLRSQYVSQAFVHGDSLKSCIVAIIVPNFEELKKWASSRKLPANSFSSLCNHPDVYRLIFNELSRFSQAEHLKYYEMVKEIYLHPDLFSYQNGLLNSAGRIKRKAVEKYFKPQLEDMFARVAV